MVEDENFYSLDKIDIVVCVLLHGFIECFFVFLLEFAAVVGVDKP